MMRKRYAAPAARGRSTAGAPGDGSRARTGSKRRGSAAVAWTIASVIVAGTVVGCSAPLLQRGRAEARLVDWLLPGEPIAVLPFETESALSNFGGQLSDEIIANLLETFPDMKIIPAPAVRNYLLQANLGAVGLPDAHAMHQMKEGLRCKYLLTGNLYTSIGVVQYTQAYADRVASGSVTVRVVDCDSLNVVWAKHVESTYSTTVYYAIGNQPPVNYLTDGQLLQGLVRTLGHEVASHFRAR